MRFWAFLCNQSLGYSDFWYKTSLIYYFEYGIGSSARKEKIGPKMAKKGVKNMHFQAFLDNQPLDLSGFGMRLAWHISLNLTQAVMQEKIFVGQKCQKHHINSLVFILEITNWHWILNYVCLGSQQNNIFSCSIGIFHVLEFSHFPFPLNFLAYIHSLSLTHSLSLAQVT